MPRESGQFLVSELESKWLSVSDLDLQPLLGIAKGHQLDPLSSDLAGNFHCLLRVKSVDPHHTKFNVGLEESVMSWASAFLFCVWLHLYDSDLIRLLGTIR